MTTEVREPQSEGISPELKERAIYPVLIPLSALILAEIFVLSMSRIFLANSQYAAAGIALGIATLVLFGAAWMAARPRLATSTIVGILVVLGLAAMVSGAYAMYLGPYWDRFEHAERPTIPVTADALVFDTDEITLPPAGAIIEFDNLDDQPHNIAIFPSATELADPIFRGDVIPGDAHITYDIPEMEEGEYYFHCDVHPAMSGTVVVDPAAVDVPHGEGDGEAPTHDDQAA